IQTVERFAALFNKSKWGIEDFDLLVRDGIYLADKISPDNRDAKRKSPATEELNYPHLIDLLNEHLVKPISSSRDPTFILASAARHCRKMLKEYLEQEELLGFDELLSSMQQAVKNPQFVMKMQSRFKAAIIDEFQDTDPVQWEIFK